MPPKRHIPQLFGGQRLKSLERVTLPTRLPLRPLCCAEVMLHVNALLSCQYVEPVNIYSMSVIHSNSASWGKNTVYCCCLRNVLFKSLTIVSNFVCSSQITTIPSLRCQNPLMNPNPLGVRMSDAQSVQACLGIWRSVSLSQDLSQCESATSGKPVLFVSLSLSRHLHYPFYQCVLFSRSYYKTTSLQPLHVRIAWFINSMLQLIFKYSGYIKGNSDHTCELCPGGRAAVDEQDSASVTLKTRVTGVILGYGTDGEIAFLQSDVLYVFSAYSEDLEYSERRSITCNMYLCCDF